MGVGLKSVYKSSLVDGCHNFEIFLIDEPADLPESLKVGLKIYSFSAALRPLQPNGVNEPMYIRTWKVEGRLFLNKYKDFVFVTSDNKLMALIRGLEVDGRRSEESGQRGKAVASNSE